MKLFFNWKNSNEQSKYAFIDDEVFNIYTCQIDQRETEYATARVLVDHLTQSNVHRFFHDKRKAIAEIGFYDDKQQMHLLFQGSMVAMPRAVSDGLFEIELQARPLDVFEQIDALVSELGKTNRYECAFYDQPTLSNVLESGQEVMCWNRVTGRLSLSHLLCGKTHRTVRDVIFEDTLKSHMGATPVNQVHVQVWGQWRQAFSDVFNLAPKIAQKFAHGKINTLHEKHLVDAWPKEGDKIGPKQTRKRTGYTVVKSRLKKLMPASYGLPKVTQPLFVKDGDKAARMRVFQHTWFHASLWVNWVYRCLCDETVMFVVKNKAPCVGGREVHLNFKIPNGNAYVANSAAPTLFRSQQGMALLDYTKRVANAYIMGASRSIEVEFCVPFAEWFDVDLDMSITVVHKSLPNGQVCGKVVRYHLHVQPDQWWVRVCVAVSSDISDAYTQVVDAVQGVSMFDDVHIANATGQWEFTAVSGVAPVDPSSWTIDDLVQVVDVQGCGVAQAAELAKIGAVHEGDTAEIDVQDYRDVLRENAFQLQVQLKDLNTVRHASVGWQA